jgi:hypothetical protein
MEYITYITFGLLMIILVAVWLWVMQAVAKTSVLLEETSIEVEEIYSDIKAVTAAFIDATNDLEDAQLANKNGPRNRRSTDKKDN